MFVRGIRRLLPTPFTYIKQSQASLFRNHYRMASTLPKLPVFEAISRHDPHSTAVVHCKSAKSFSYGQLLEDVADARDQLHDARGGQPLKGERVAFMVENGYDYVGAIPMVNAPIFQPLTWYSESIIYLSQR